MGAFMGSAGRFAEGVEELEAKGWKKIETVMSNESTIYYEMEQPNGTRVIVGDRYDPPNPFDAGCYLFGDPEGFRESMQRRQEAWDRIVGRKPSK